MAIDPAEDAGICKLQNARKFVAMRRDVRSVGGIVVEWYSGLRTHAAINLLSPNYVRIKIRSTWPGETAESASWVRPRMDS